MEVAGFGAETIVPDSAVLPLPADVNLEQAALLGCAMLTGVGAVTNSARVQPGESVVVFGTGGVGLSVLQGARLVGAEVGRTLSGCVFGSSDVERDLPFLLEHMQAGRIRPEELVTNRIGLEDVPDALARMGARKGARSLIVYD